MNVHSFKNLLNELLKPDGGTLPVSVRTQHPAFKTDNRFVPVDPVRFKEIGTFADVFWKGAQVDRVPIGEDQPVDEDGGIMVCFEVTREIEFHLRVIDLGHPPQKQFVIDDLPGGLVSPDTSWSGRKEIPILKWPHLEIKLLQRKRF